MARFACGVFSALFFLLADGLLASDASIPGEVIQERPTLRCLGARWLVGGDANRNARISVEYRKQGTSDWRKGLDLLRVETSAIREAVRPPEGQVLFAGSVVGLEEDTPYEVKLSLVDPDGGSADRTVQMRTWREPQLPRGGRTVEVRPGELEQALKRAKPGDVLRLHAGVYRGAWQPRSGEPGRPIAIVGAGDGEVILDGQGGKSVLNTSGLHDAFLEGLTVHNAANGIVIHGASRVTIRRCTIRDVEYGIVAIRNQPVQQEILLADNTITGRSTWPRTKGIEDRRGIQISGVGNVVCYNRVCRFADAIDTFSTYPCSAIDIHNNEISKCTDDGIEMDYSEHNTRCFENRLTNVFQGISLQPVHGGPVYVFRNAMYNVSLETFKLHNAPSGGILYHNTSVKAGPALVLYTNQPVSNCKSRNNLFVGTTGSYAYENNAPMRNCDFDGDGFAGSWRAFLKWNGKRYETIEDAARRAPVYRHAIQVAAEGLFRSNAAAPEKTEGQFPVDVNDLRLAEGSAAIDAGVKIPGINDLHHGKSPDLGAYESGDPLPHYGPRPR